MSARAGNGGSPGARLPALQARGVKGRARWHGHRPQRSPGHAAGRPRVPPPWGREVAPVGLGAASRGSAQDVGSLSALGALWSWGSRSSRGRSGQGGRSADSEAPWGPAAEVLGGPSGHSQALRAPLRSPWLRCDAGLVCGSKLGALAGMDSALGSPADSPFWPFCPRLVPSSWCLGRTVLNTDEDRRGERFPLRSPELHGGSSRALYTRCSRGVGLPHPRCGPTRASGGEHAHQPLIPACRCLGTCVRRR